MSGTELNNLPACGVRRHELMRHRFGELAHEDSVRIQGHIGECAFCQARLREIEAEDNAFRAANDAGVASAQILERLEAREAPRTGILNRPWERLGAASLWTGRFRPLTAALVIVLCAVPATVLWIKAHPEKTTRTKGGVALEMFVKDAVLGARPAPDGTTLKEGDQIQFRYRADGKRYVFVVSVTDQGVFSPLYPDRPSASIEVTPSGTHVLDGSVILDDAHGPERIIALFSDRPLTFDDVKAAIEANLRKETSVTRLQALELGLDDVEPATVLIQKE
jgi:hypothetical protein